jgi:rhodanese-related sulfurtransferase
MKARFSMFAAMFAAASLLMSGPTLAQNYPDSVKQMVSAAKKQVPTINLEQFKAAFDKNDLGLIVDVRNPDEFAEGHIPGAVNVSRGLLEFTIWNHVGFPDKTDMNKKMTLYCKSGGRCALATKSLRDLGFTNVTSADMTFESWVKAGYPVAKPAK